MERVIAVTPAGRQGYLELLGHYVLADPTIAEWRLWDNCRAEGDRAYINELAARHEKVTVVTPAASDGSNRSINQFYRGCDDPEAFYIKMDDDLVLLPPRFGEGLLARALATRARNLWWSPLVINNAICTWLIKHFSGVEIGAELTAQAGCPMGWRNGRFAERLHLAFLDALRTGRIDAFAVPDQDVLLSRFSINCLGFFGSDVAAAGPDFCPPGVDDEEWLSAVLPARLGRPGRILGDLVVAHFSFFPQEATLLRTEVLEAYYGVTGLALTHRPARKENWRDQAKGRLLDRFLTPRAPYAIGVRR